MTSNANLSFSFKPIKISHDLDVQENGLNLFVASSTRLQNALKSSVTSLDVLFFIDITFTSHSLHAKGCNLAK